MENLSPIHPNYKSPESIMDAHAHRMDIYAGITVFCIAVVCIAFGFFIGRFTNILG